MLGDKRHIIYQCIAKKVTGGSLERYIKITSNNSDVCFKQLSGASSVGGVTR